MERNICTRFKRVWIVTNNFVNRRSFVERLQIQFKSSEVNHLILVYGNYHQHGI